jgi:Zn-dependent protease with chaperone function
MNFFESQDRVHKNTTKLVILFALAVVTLIIMTNLLVMMVFGYLSSEQLANHGTAMQTMDWQVFLTVTTGVAFVVITGSLYKIAALSGGGKNVAEALDGQLIPQNTKDLHQRKLLNVVEEMAIASGTPAPPVYLLADEAGINAFAAGFSPRDAVIGVTQGTIEQLSRDQLQGVIAHEFSHIFNGDMKLNIRLMGVLHGILILGMIGYYILRFGSHGRSRSKNGGGILALGIGLMVIGFAGTFFGGLIKAAVSRQREYLADASAVQFTRNPDGIAGALKRIGGAEFGSAVENPGAPEVSHAFFAQGISGFMASLSATHPPLKKRILAIDPHWDGDFYYKDLVEDLAAEEKTQKVKTQPKENRSRDKMAAVVAGAAVLSAIDQIGNPKQETIDYARTLLAELPTDIKESAREPFGARAIIYSLLLDNENDIRAKQIQQLKNHADPDVYALTLKLMAQINELDAQFNLVIIDIAIPALKQLSLSQYKAFKENLIALIQMDSRVDLMEWSLQKILLNHLDGHFFKLSHARPRYAHTKQVRGEIEMMLSVMAYAGHRKRSEAEQAFQAAAKMLELKELKLLPQKNISVAGLDKALKKLAKLKPLLKPRILKACAASVVHDQQVLPVEVELLRAFSDVLDCPMPPVI